MNEEKETTHKEPIEGTKVWLLLRYPNNIQYLDIQVNTVITLPRGNRDGSPFTKKFVNFLPFILQKILLNIKDVEF